MIQNTKRHLFRGLTAMETLLCRQVLLQLAGYPTEDFIQNSSQSLSFTVRSTVEPSRKIALERFLEYGNHFLVVRDYTRRFSSHSSGFIHHGMYIWLLQF